MKEKKEKEVKLAEVTDESGSTLLTMRKIGIEGNRMTVVGSLMGAWETTMYVEPQDVCRVIKLILNWNVIGYVLSLPFRKRSSKRHG